MGRKTKEISVSEGNPLRNILKRSIKVAKQVEFIPTGILPFDAVIGGVPVGHITLIGGMPGSGKTLFCLEIASEHIRQGGTVVYADTEGSITQQRLETAGIPVDLIDERLFLERYIMLEDCLTDIKNLLVRLAEEGNDKKILIVLDSLSSLLPTKWEEATSGEKGLISDAPIGVFARVGSVFLAGLPNLLQQANAALVITTQMRADIGAAGRGAPFKMFKFYALEHLSHLVLQLYTPEGFTPPFVAALEAEDEKEKVLAIKSAYHKVRIGVRKAQVFASQTAVPPNLDLSFFYPVVNIPQLGLQAGKVDNIYHALVYGVLTGVLTKEIKPGIGTVFYLPLDGEKVIRFSYIDAYKNQKLRQLLLNEVSAAIKQKIAQLITAEAKGREVFKSAETDLGEDKEVDSTEEG